MKRVPTGQPRLPNAPRDAGSQGGARRQPARGKCSYPQRGLQFLHSGGLERCRRYLVAHHGLDHAITVGTEFSPGAWWLGGPSGEESDSFLTADVGAKEIAHRVHYDRVANERGFAFRPRADGPFLGWLAVDA